ncbi:hypothetical protein Cabys_2039 [Caldithrix abyssi DSM 13497]|uniref:Uncharacterized protein n=1 Tax=Caldithrix abyssi DSM 13497 TaxID=880073 RepID=A0A1J1C8Q9_CALAY|nr:hypothetical protein Cabys_2039 [Caldithrix abyssi DSM 13497]
MKNPSFIGRRISVIFLAFSNYLNFSPFRFCLFGALVV